MKGIYESNACCGAPAAAHTIELHGDRNDRGHAGHEFAKRRRATQSMI